ARRSAPESQRPAAGARARAADRAAKPPATAPPQSERVADRRNPLLVRSPVAAAPRAARVARPRASAELRSVAVVAVAKPPAAEAEDDRPGPGNEPADRPHCS